MLSVPTVSMWALGIFEDRKVLCILSPPVSAMTVLLHSFLHPATASQAPYQPPFLLFLSSALPGSCFPAESQENIGGGGRHLRETRVRESWPQDNVVCSRSQSSSIRTSQKQCQSETRQEGALLSIPRTSKPRTAAGYVSRIWQQRAFKRRRLLLLDTNKENVTLY